MNLEPKLIQQSSQQSQSTNRDGTENMDLESLTVAEAIEHMRTQERLLEGLSSLSLLLDDILELGRPDLLPTYL